MHMTALRATLLTMMLLESAHLVSPVLLAWTRRELREIVKQEWVRHLALPAVILPACVLAPTEWVIGIYYTINIWHFSSQNFGVWQLFGRKVTPDGRARRALICHGATTFGMVLMPILWPGIYGLILGTIVFSLNHWITDLALSSRVAPRAWHFLGAALLVAAAYTVARQGPLSAHVLPQILVLRCGAGFIHFQYSRSCWRLSDHRVRQVVGSAFRLASGVSKCPTNCRVATKSSPSAPIASSIANW